MAPASELTRVVAEGDGGLKVSSSSAGRGAWLCRGKDACVELALKRRAFSRALRREIAPEAVGAIRRQLVDAAGPRDLGRTAGT